MSQRPGWPVLRAGSCRPGRLERAFGIVVLLYLGSAFITILRPSAAVRGADSDPALQAIWLMLVLTAAALVSCRRSHLPATPYPLTLVLFLLLCTASVVWSVDAGLTLKRLASLLGTVIVAAYLTRSFLFRELLQLVRWSALIGGLSSALYALVSSRAFDSYGRFQGVYPHKNTLGLAMALGVLACYAALMPKPFEPFRITAEVVRTLIAGFVLTGVLVASGSRTPAAALLVACVAVTIQRVASTRVGRTRAVIVSMFVGGAALFVLALERAALVESVTRVSLTGRWQLWRAVIGVIRMRPLLGWGYGAFWSPSHLPQAFADQVQAASTNALSANEGYLETALSVGIVGTGILIAFILATLSSAASVRGEAILEVVGCTGIISFLAIYAFAESDVFQSRSILTVLVISAALVTARQRSLAHTAARSDAATGTLESNGPPDWQMAPGGRLPR